jgi:endonuclease YncB( thermonuclease family)
LALELIKNKLNFITMGFILIKGIFTPANGVPDGDSVRFKPNNVNLLKKLEGVKAKVSATTGTVQLRFEGIDAIEKGAIQPLSVEAKDNMLKLIGFNKNTNKTPKGYILARMTDPNGRAVAFVFAGEPSQADGSDVFLDADLLKKSVNFKQVQDGFAYPLYYNTLFASLRNTFNTALKKAQNSKLGYWKTDKSLLGVTVNNKASLATIDPIWPKLWRRLEEFLANRNSLNGFLDWIDSKNERVIKIDSADETGLVNTLVVNGNTVKMIEKPENLMIVTTINR